MMDNPEPSSGSVNERLDKHPFLDALLQRRSHRFALGMTMPAGPLAYESKYQPAPLTEDEEAALAFAAVGITGPAMADLCFANGQGGNIMAGLTGRTIASGDGLQTVALAVTNDTATYLIKRPRDFAPAEIRELIDLAERKEFTEIYRLTRLKIKNERAKTPTDPLFNINANQWSANAVGTSYFLPINDLTFMYINGLLEILGATTGAFILDERANYRPAGLKAFARSKGGHLDDNTINGRVITIRLVEQFVSEFVTVEQGMMLQNLGLMAQALGLGGFPNFANHEFGWFEALGFRMQRMPASRYLGVNPLVRLGLKFAKQDVEIPCPIGLERDGKPLLKPFSPPYYPSMKDAVLAVVDAKFGSQGVLRSKTGISGWRDHAKITGQIPPVSQAAIDATIAYCEYVWEQYGRFPAYMPPFRTVLGFQACHLDKEFYDRFYHPDALSDAQREDFARQAKTRAKA